MSTDVVSAETAQQVIDAVNAAREIGGMSSTEEADTLTMERLARTVLTLHARLSAQRDEAVRATELARAELAAERTLLNRALSREAALNAQLGPLCAVHDALREAAALPGAGASGAEMVAAVRAQGAEAMRADISAILDARADRLGKSTLPREGDIAAVFAEAAAVARGVPVRALPLPGAEVSR